MKLLLLIPCALLGFCSTPSAPDGIDAACAQAIAAPSGPPMQVK